MIDRVYQVVKRDGVVVSFDIAKIAAAITKAFEATREIDEEMNDLLFMGSDIEEEALRAMMSILEERKRELKQYCKQLIVSMNGILRTCWLRRNSGAGRSNTSAVSDKMLLTIPTPPTAVAANRSLRQRGMAYGAMA